MSSPKILLIDDDQDIKNIVERALSPLLTLDYAQSFEEAKKLISVNEYHLVLLDLNLEQENGLDILEFPGNSNLLELEKTIIITSEQSLENEIRTHNLGARDYIKKPFNLKLLESILNKHLINIIKGPKSSIQKGPFLLDLTIHEAFILSEDKTTRKLNLTYKEFLILKVLIERIGQVFSRENIFEKIWDQSSESCPRTVDMHIYSLRKKISPYAHFIKNKRSVGYYFELD